MLKKQFLKTALVTLAVMLSFACVLPAYCAIETSLLVDVSASTDNVPYQQTQWYGFSGVGGKGYCATLTPLTGNSDLYLLDNGFNLKTSSKNTGLTVDKVWYGQASSGPMHVAAYGIANPSTNYTIQVISAPYVTSISPALGGAGTLVTINGFGFGATRGTSYVKFGNTQATGYYSWTNTQIKVYVPSGAGSGTVTINVYVASVTSNAKNFNLPALASSDGTMFRYDLGRTANYPNGPTTFPLNLLWRYVPVVGSMWSYSGGIKSSPVIANGTVYVAGTEYDTNKAIDKLFALDVNTGSLKWSYVTGNNFNQNGPAVANGIVYGAASWYLSATNNYAGKIYALDANTGALKWSYSISNQIDASPLVVNGIVYLGARNGIFYALDAITGTVKWSYDIGATSGRGSILGSAAFTNNTLYFAGMQDYGNSNSYLFALDAGTGALKWKTGAGNFVYSIPAVDNNTVFVNNGANLSAYDATSGTLRWKYSVTGVGNGGWSCPATANGIVYATLGTNIYALDANTGSQKWSYDAGYGQMSPSVSNNIVYLLVYDTIIALDATAGSLKWSYYDHYYAYGNITSPVIANGKIYAIFGAGLNCFSQ